MSSKLISPAIYGFVLIALVGLTILTVGVSFLHIAGTWHVVIGVSIAMLKASLVALFFMHLIHANQAVWAVALVSLFWLSCVLLLLTFSDYISRPWFPFNPGH